MKLIATLSAPFALLLAATFAGAVEDEQICKSGLCVVEFNASFNTILLRAYRSEFRNLRAALGIHQGDAQAGGSVMQRLASRASTDDPTPGGPAGPSPVTVTTAEAAAAPREGRRARAAHRLAHQVQPCSWWRRGPVGVR